MEESPQARPAVVVDGVAKTFKVPHEQLLTLKERALHPFKRTTHERFEALKGVSFTVAPGEFFGIVGRNGSGKSTLLKCLAGIYRADAGRIYVNGRVSTFIELGVGFNPDLAARDNVIMNGIMLGLTPREARARFDQVIDFAELEDFVDLKLKNYSSGMSVRLAFSVMIQADADILLIDEVLAVGDASFQQKCFDVFNGLRDAGKTIIFVTHDMAAVNRFCHRAMLLEHGEPVEISAPADVANKYMELNFGRSADGDTGPRMGDGAATIEEVWMEDEAGERTRNLIQGRPCTLAARVRFNQDAVDPSFTAAFVNETRQNAFAPGTLTDTEHTGTFRAGESVTFRARFDNHLGAGRYDISFLVSHRGTGEDAMERWERIISVLVAGPRASGALIDLPSEIALQRAGSANDLQAAAP